MMSDFPLFKRRQLLRCGVPFIWLAYQTVHAKSTTSSKLIQTLAVRLWPAKDYTRVTLEFSHEVNFRHQLLKNPDRLVVDVDDVQLNGLLSAMEKVTVATDPYLKGFRVAQFTQQSIRLVLELKQEVRPQVFSATPIGHYQYRFFIDLYPLIDADPLLTLLQLHESFDLPTLSPPSKAINALPSIKKPPTINENKTQSTPHKPPIINAPAIKRQQRQLIIVLDPGHGGEDPGAVGTMGTYEKNIVLAIAEQTKKRVESLGMLAPLTRDRDFFIPLSQRVAKARRYKADLFISIHADAFMRKEASGSSIYVASDKSASSQAARWLAQKENSADLMGGLLLHRDINVASALLDLTQSHTRLQSDKLAQKILGELSHVNRLHKEQVEYANFAVLKAPDIPSALIETAFISNPTEERRLRTPDYQQSLAQAIARGIHFFQQIMRG